VFDLASANPRAVTRSITNTRRDRVSWRIDVRRLDPQTPCHFQMPQARSRNLAAAIRYVLVAVALVLSVSPAPSQTGGTITVDAAAPARPFPHFWEQVFGSGRAALSLRESYRRDLDAVKAVTGLEYVRFHAIFHDENGVYSEDQQGNPVLNFNQVDMIYDGLLDRGVKPFVELSFMPRALASKPVEHPFWYKQLVAPPKDDAKWAALIEAFARHLVERYGIGEVSSWWFEVWNEPNIDFWAGEPKFDSYLGLYAGAAKALKKVSPRLRVGGPATAQAAWCGRFIDYCVEHDLPIDFVSTHVYANDTPQDVLNEEGPVNRRTMVARAVEKVFQEVRQSRKPGLPIHWSEYNASYRNEVDVTDSAYMGPWLGETIAAADGKVATMSYWTFSDVFEEQGIFKAPFYGGFGLIAPRGIPKAAFHVFRLLHLLGDQRMEAPADLAIVTRRHDGSFAVAMWNYAEPGMRGSGKTVTVELRGIAAPSARLHRVDSTHHSALEEWIRMGRPASPDREQIERLRAAAAAAQPEAIPVNNSRIQVLLPAPGFALLEIGLAPQNE
jgi:xylan 1,4-beta-xylosidase